jgi:hypothetical protein
MYNRNASTERHAEVAAASVRRVGFGSVGLYGMVLLSLGIAAAAFTSAAQRSARTNQFQTDEEGNLYAVKADGTRIKMADARHCSVSQGTEDQQFIACQVAPKKPDGFPYHFLQLEIYQSDGQRHSIETGAEIMEWHFWDHGRQIAVYWQGRSGERSHVLYDTATAHALDTIADPPDESLLPQWAKNRSQVEDESVPMSPALTEERTKWVAKVLRRIQKIRPGMLRTDLEKIFTTEGGRSNRFWHRYVLMECPYIKVDVQFKAATNKSEDIKEDPNDIITSISKPYLEWSIMD